MKLVLIAYDEAYDSEVMHVLASAGAHNYTRWTQVQGKGAAGGPHLGTPVWPKRNNALVAAVEDHQAAGILEGIRDLRSRPRRLGLKAFVLPLDEVT